MTTIKDEPGSAIYLIHNGTEGDKQAFERLSEDISRRTKKQIVSMSARDDDAAKVISFYQLRGSHFVLIVRDDDQLHQAWTDGDLLDAAQIAYIADQAG